MNIRRCIALMTAFSLISFVTFGQIGTTPIYLKFRADKVYVINQERVEITADLYIGTSEHPVSGLYAASFDLIFPTDVIAADLTFFKYYPSSFLGKNGDIQHFNKSPEFLKEGRLNISISRNDGKSVSGFGKIGEVSFVIMTDIIGSRNVEETPFTVKMEYVKLWDVERNELPHEIDEDGATIIIVNDILARNSQRTNQKQVEIYPNPAREVLSIHLQNVRGERVELFNAAGQRVWRDQVSGDQVQVSTKDLRSGIYTVKIHTEEGVITRRVLVQ